MLSMKMKPPVKLGKDKESEMRTWARVYGKAVRQRSNRQQTTMASAGTLPSYLYEIQSTAPVHNVRKLFCLYTEINLFLQILKCLPL